VTHDRTNFGQSNRTCPIKASGSPTGFTVRHTESKLTARGFGTVSNSLSPLYALCRSNKGAALKVVAVSLHDVFFAVGHRLYENSQQRS
jgi:hypothetical protein